MIRAQLVKVVREADLPKVAALPVVSTHDASLEHLIRQHEVERIRRVDPRPAPRGRGTSVQEPYGYD